MQFSKITSDHVHSSLGGPFPGKVGFKYSDDGETIPCVVPLKEGKFCTPERGWSVPGRTYITMQGMTYFKFYFYIAT